MIVTVTVCIGRGQTLGAHQVLTHCREEAPQTQKLAGLDKSVYRDLGAGQVCV